MANIHVLYSLRALLLDKIYLANKNLIRNDSMAAKLVFEYVNLVDEIVHSGCDGGNLKFEAAREIRFRIEPLIGLSEHTIRKYIAELWGAGHWMQGYIRIETDRFVHWDSRQN